MIEDKKDITKNIKDENSRDNNSVKDINPPFRYSKTNKLITALFMVTDIMDKDEPLRHKLREIGTDILRDVYSNSSRVVLRVDEILSFLDIANTLGMISDMNKNILLKEFYLLRNSFEQVNPAWIENFIDEDIGQKEQISKITPYQARLGIQKGSTLLKALSNVKMSDRFENPKHSGSMSHRIENFDLVKKERREEILNIIRSKKSETESGLTITDIRNEAKLSSKGHLITGTSEKTLQRELVSMVKDNILKKTGEKRWSKYFI